MHTVEVDGAGAIFNGDLSGRVEFVVERDGQSTQRFIVPAELIREIYERCFGAIGRTRHQPYYDVEQYYEDPPPKVVECKCGAVLIGNPLHRCEEE